MRVPPRASPPLHVKTAQPQRSISPRPLDDDPGNEQSPLMKPRSSDELDELYKVVSPIESDDWEGEVEEEAKSTWYLILLTLGGLGLQIVWSVETSNGSPYLLSLGLSKSLLALVWIAGPLSGILVQPYVGMKSDNCRIRWGKRRPFIVGGLIATIVSIFVLAWAREIVSGFFGIFGANKESQWVKNCVLLFAVLFVYVLDFAINVMQAGLRAFIVDCAPTHQQEIANAWMMRISGLGGILCYIAGAANLPESLPWLGDSQFKVLCALAALAMAISVGISCGTIHERDPRFDDNPEAHDGAIAFFKSLYRSIRSLPPQIRNVCEVQFFAWLGWFPFLFYISTYVGGIYAEPYFKKNPNMSDEQIDQLWEEATRVGTRALLIFAITTFALSVILPIIIPPTYQGPEPNSIMTPRTPMRPMAPGTPGSLSRTEYFGLRASGKFTQRTMTSRITSYLALLQIRRLTLRRAWTLSHITFAFLMAMTFLVRDTFTATILVACIGIPWTLTSWAPFALISSEISKREAMRRGMLRPADPDAALIAAGEDDASAHGADQAGVVLGIHNVAVAAPQGIATLISSIIFKLLQKPRGAPGDNSVAWVLRFGGCCALIAAWLSTRVNEESVDTETASPRRRRAS